MNRKLAEGFPFPEISVNRHVRDQFDVAERHDIERVDQGRPAGR